MATGSVRSAANVVEVSVSTTDLTFEARAGWYRANMGISSIFNRNDISLVQTVAWSGTGMPIITQLDHEYVQFISPQVPNAGSITVRGIIL